jgi:Fe-Mn family superoxide dismutase
MAAPGGVRIGPRWSAQQNLTEPLVLEPLPYGFAALEPHIDQMTMEIHYGKHHQTYVDNLNKLVAEHPELAELEDPFQALVDPTLIAEEIRPAFRNNLGGHVNHQAFWHLMTPDSLDPSPRLLDAINRDFGSVEEMQAAVNDGGLKRFGSGWTWLVSDAAGVLSVVSTPNQDNPLMDGGTSLPILGIDVWEHAYYLKYQNRRADFLTAWWNVVNWETVDMYYGWVFESEATPGS